MGASFKSERNLVEARRCRCPHIGSVAAAAHELRTPLTPILLQANLLRRFRLGPLSPRQQDALEILNRNVERLIGAVEEVIRLLSVHVRQEDDEAAPSRQGPLAA